VIAKQPEAKKACAMSNGTAIQAGIAFGPNNSGKRYVSVYAHRGNRPQKSKWVVAPQQEYGLFCAADDGNWSDDNGNYWSLHDNGQAVLGMMGERLAKFPFTAADEPWHGYPVSTREGDENSPPDFLVERWIASAVVSKTFGRRIERRKI
jgi:hypothetical protein